VGLFFASVIGAWIYSLVVQNRSRRAEDELEDLLADRMPVNSDELLELRAYNDVDTDAIKSLVPRLARRGCALRATPALLVSVLEEAAGRPLREVYAVERMLTALPTAPDGTVEVRTAVGALCFLSNGPVAERLSALFEIAADTTGSLGPAELGALIECLRLTGQVPVEKQVSVDDEGKNELGIARAWYRVQPVHEFSGAELLSEALAAIASAASPPAHAPEAGPVEPAAEAETAKPEGLVVDPLGAPASQEEVRDVEAFMAVMTSSQVCIWGECFLIAERRRAQKKREENEEYERNPPSWQFWKWGRTAPTSETLGPGKES